MVKKQKPPASECEQDYEHLRTLTWPTGRYDCYPDKVAPSEYNSFMRVLCSPITSSHPETGKTLSNAIIQGVSNCVQGSDVPLLLLPLAPPTLQPPWSILPNAICFALYSLACLVEERRRGQPVSVVFGEDNLPSWKEVIDGVFSDLDESSQGMGSSLKAALKYCLDLSFSLVEAEGRPVNMMPMQQQYVGMQYFAPLFRSVLRRLKGTLKIGRLVFVTAYWPETKRDVFFCALFDLCVIDLAPNSILGALKSYSSYLASFVESLSWLGYTHYGAAANSEHEHNKNDEYDDNT